MDSILVISMEASLAETLASELPGIDVRHMTAVKTTEHILKEPYRLIVVDESMDANLAPMTGKTPVIRLTRPVRLSELLYTIRGALQGKSAISREELNVGEGFRFSPLERTLRSAEGDMHITLTEKETGLLQCLVEADGKVVPREKLLKSVWGYSDDIATHTLETHIYRLRGKLSQASSALDILSSEEGGYLLKVIPA